MARFGRTYIKLGLVRPVEITGAVLEENKSDTEGLTDSLSLSQGENQVLSDTEGLTDSLVLTFNEVNSFSDTEGLTDSTILSSGEVNNFSDTEGLSDSLAFTTGIVFSDPMGMTDSFTLGTLFSETFSDPLGMTDSVELTLAYDPNVPLFLGPDNTLVQGPGTLYLAAYGATEPATSAVGAAPDSGTWTDLGGLLGGVELVVEQEWEEIEPKQVNVPAVRRLKRRQLTIKTQMAETTLANLGYALNDSAGVSGVQYQPSDISEATPLTYMALIVDGWAPGFKLANRRHRRRRVIVRKVLSMSNVDFAYKKDGQTVFTVTWACHYVDSSTPPFRIIDEAGD